MRRNSPPCGPNEICSVVPQPSGLADRGKSASPETVSARRRRTRRISGILRRTPAGGMLASRMHQTFTRCRARGARQGNTWLIPVLAVFRIGAAADLPLIDAVKKADTAAVRQLIPRKVDVNAPALDGSTALHWAVQHDAVEIVDELLRAGANVKATSRYGVPPLSLAARTVISDRRALLKAGRSEHDAPWR